MTAIGKTVLQCFIARMSIEDSESDAEMLFCLSPSLYENLIYRQWPFVRIIPRIQIESGY